MSGATRRRVKPLSAFGSFHRSSHTRFYISPTTSISPLASRTWPMYLDARTKGFRGIPILASLDPPPVVALLRACVEKRGGTTGVLGRRASDRRGKRKRCSLTYERRERTETWPVNAEDTNGHRDRETRMYIYIHESVQNTQAVTTDQAGETDADA